MVIFKYCDNLTKDNFNMICNVTSTDKFT